MKSYSQNIVIDLEFTQVDQKYKRRTFRQEIIQIGSVRVSPSGEVLDSFSSYVRPEYTSSVSVKVRDLTGIRFRDVYDENSLSVVLGLFREWVGDKGRTRFVTWSENDLKQLRQETSFKEIEFPEAHKRWLDLQKIYPRIMAVGNGKRMSLHSAADWYGIKLSEENLHGALYDARVTAELLRNLLTKDYLIQKNMLTEVMPGQGNSKSASYSIGDKFSSLLALKERLENEG